MADDELSAPLGQNAKKKRRRFRLPIRIPHVDRRRARAVSAGLRGLGAGGRRSARRRARRGGRDRLRSCRSRPPAVPTRGVGGEQGPRSYDGPGAPREAGPQMPAPRARCRPPPPLRRQHQDRHHHRRLDRQATGGRSRASRDVRAPLEQRLLETLAPRRHSAHRARRRAAGRNLRPRRRPAAGQQGRSAGRHRDRRARRQRQRHPAGDGKTARRR